MITSRYLALLTTFTGVPLLDRFKWEVGALVRLGGMLTILVLARDGNRIASMIFFDICYGEKLRCDAK